MAIAIVLLSVPFAWYKTINMSEFLREWRSDWKVLISKSNFGEFRFTHFLAIAYLAWIAAGPGGERPIRSGWTGKIIAIVSRVGQQSLAFFATSMVLARVFGALLSLAGGGALAALVINVVGAIIIIGVAKLAAFFKSQP